MLAVVEGRVLGRVGTLGAAEVSEGVAEVIDGEVIDDVVVVDRATPVPVRSQGFGGDGIVGEEETRRRCAVREFRYQITCELGA